MKVLSSCYNVLYLYHCVAVLLIVSASMTSIQGQNEGSILMLQCSVSVSGPSSTAIDSSRPFTVYTFVAKY